MNQHRWTCISTVILATVLAPIANVYAQIPTATIAATQENQQQSLPIITPLTVTEIETDVAVLKIAARENLPRTDTSIPISSVRSIPSIQPETPTPIQNTTPLQSEAEVFSLDRPSVPVVSSSNSSDMPLTNPPRAVVKVPPLQPDLQPFVVKAVSSNLIVRRSSGLKPTKITNTATIQAEFARLPQLAPSISQTEDLLDTLGFAGGTPIFVFDSDRPQQIFATAIAQVDGTTIAPEPSISIPVQRPNQSVSPTLAPIPTQFDPNPIQPIQSIQPTPVQVVAVHTGKASWYGREAGPRTANGERYNPEGLTAAHRTLPFGTKVRVISLKTGKSVTLRINDRGPFRSKRIIDISAGAAAAIGIKKDGIGDVRMEVLAKGG